MTQDGSTSSARQQIGTASGIVWLVMIASLMVNAFLVGAIVGRDVGDKKAFLSIPGEDAARNANLGNAHGMRGDFTFSTRAYLRHLSPESRRLFFQEMRAERREIRKKAKEVVESRRAVLDAINASHFDDLAFAAALDRASEADAAIRQSGVDLLVQTVPRLPPEERKRIGAVLERQFEARLQRQLRPSDQFPHANEQGLRRGSNSSDSADRAEPRSQGVGTGEPMVPANQ